MCEIDCLVFFLKKKKFVVIFNCMDFFMQARGPNPEKAGWGARRVGAQTQKKWGPEGSPNPEKVGARRVGPEGWGPEGWVGGPKISPFFSSPTIKFVLFFPFWRPFVEFGGVLEALGP